MVSQPFKVNTKSSKITTVSESNINNNEEEKYKLIENQFNYKKEEISKNTQSNISISTAKSSSLYDSNAVSTKSLNH